jgi:hypothetical protein
MIINLILIWFLEKIGNFKIKGDRFFGEAFHPKWKDYLLGVTIVEIAVLMKVNSTDWIMVKEEELFLETGDSNIITFNLNGLIAVLVSYYSKICVIEFD